jgi:N-acetylmuramoyl-L-alanine amidase
MMRRRDFLKAIPGLAYLLTDTRWMFARALPEWSHNQSLTIYTSDSTTPITIPITHLGRNVYINARQFAEALKYNTYFNEQRMKMVLYLPQNKVVVSANNPFIIIDNRTLQMPISCRVMQNDIYVPLQYWMPLITQFANVNWNYDPREQLLRIGNLHFQIVSIDIDSRENGVVIRIPTAKKFNAGEMSVDMRNEWLHVDLYGAKGDVNALSRTKAVGGVRQVKAYQFESLLSIAFKLRKLPLSREIYQDAVSNEVVVVLRYKEQIAEQQSSQQADEARMDRTEQPGRDEENNVRQELEAERQKWMIDTIVIDPGHGGKDPGAIGVGGLKEKDIVLAVGLKLGELIKRRMPGVKVIFTRTDDTFVELRRRTQIANESRAKLFISIHANANRSSRAAGFETYLLGPNKGEQASNVAQRENDVIRFESAENQAHYKGINAILARLAQTAFMKQSEHLAASVQDQLSRQLTPLKMKDRGVKQAGFWVMVGAAMPSVLVETGFITNRYDAKILRTKAHQQRIAEGIFAGLARFKNDYENSI